MDLQDLVAQILLVNNNDFIVEITDNSSTDNTVQLLKNIQDKRLKVYKNEHNIGGVNNMVQAVYNCSAKYALFLNDREVFNPNGLTTLINTLRNKEYSFMHITEQHKSVNATGDLAEYEKGEPSILRHGYTHHPSGLVYNTSMLKSSYKMDRYLSSSSRYKHSLMALDLMRMGKTAYYDLGLWHERPDYYKEQNLSGADVQAIGNENKLYFHPDQILADFREIVRFLFYIPCNASACDYKNKELIIENLLDYHFRRFVAYKFIMQSKTECAHYKVDAKLITTYSFIKMWNVYDRSICGILADAGNGDSVNKWRNKGARHLIHLLFISFLGDVYYYCPFITKLRRYMKNVFRA